MTIEIANAMAGYFTILSKLNKVLIKLCGEGAGGYNTFSNNGVELLEVINEIPRLIPYKYNRACEEIELLKTDGLIEFKTDIEYLFKDYNMIFAKHYELLDKIRKIRNKYQHKMHSLQHEYTTSGTDELFSYVYRIDEQNIKVNDNEIIALMKDLNILFDKIRNDACIYAQENNKKSYAYYHRLSTINFLNFNAVYDSPLLKTFGKILIDF